MLPPADFILTKIIATIGPACAEVPTLVRLIEEGVRVVRINFSHGTFDQFEASLRAVREAARVAERPVGVLGDLSGPKLRLTAVEDGNLSVEVGDTVSFTSEDIVGCRGEGGDVVLSTTYPSLVDEVQPGDRVLVDDGLIRMIAVECKPTARPEGGEGRLLCCRVTAGGKLQDKKGVNLPDTDLSAPSLTEWDEACAAWAVEHDLDYLALSFVRRAEDVKRLKVLLDKVGKGTPRWRSGLRMPVVAKVEKPEATREIDGICEISDAIMVARGDLGVEMELAEVPILQKRIIESAHAWGKPVIVATQMLQSMIEQSTPTRAEVGDVANAIIDGADATMLSGETAVGRFPILAVHAMTQAARHAEAYVAERATGHTHPPRRLQESRYRTAALAHGVSVIVKDLDAKFVATWSELGGAARYLSQNRLRVPIIAISSNEPALRQMSLLFGVRPVYMERPPDSTAFLERLDILLLENGWAENGDAVVVVKGEPLGTPGVTNQTLIHYVGDVCRVRWHAG